MSVIIHRYDLDEAGYVGDVVWPSTRLMHLTRHYGPNQGSSAICILSDPRLRVQFSDEGYNEPCNAEDFLVPSWLSPLEVDYLEAVTLAFQKCVENWENNR